MIAVDELVHTIKQIAGQNQIEHRPWVYGHVSSYNPANNTVRVLVPSMVDDQTGSPLHSGWMPLGVPQSGGQSGLQVVPFGGATAENPTAGELCLVAINERGTGVAAVVAMLYTDRQQPPHTALQSGLQPGEVVLRHVSGTVVRLHKNGDAEVTTGGDGAVNVTTNGTGGVNLTTNGGGNVQLLATGSGTVALTSVNPITIDAPKVTMVANLEVTGSVIGGFGTPDQVNLQTHRNTGVQIGANISGPPLPGS